MASRTFPKAAAPVKWVAYSVFPSNNHQAVGLEELAKKVKEASKGKVEITVQAGGALGYKGPELLMRIWLFSLRVYARAKKVMAAPAKKWSLSGRFNLEAVAKQKTCPHCLFPIVCDFLHH